jgi:3-oxoacyl-[acyl-carrier protein] reductase
MSQEIFKEDINMQNGSKVAVITGGTRGIGLGISKRLSADGMKVLLVYRSNTEEAQKAKRAIQQDGNDVEIIQADVSKAADTLRVVKCAEDMWGRIDILVNNAGIFDFSFLEEMSEEFWDKVFSTNLKSMMLMTKAAIPLMKKNHWGRIINATSISGSFGDVGLTAYSCSKAGVNIFTTIMSGELGPYGITVNAYAPGIINTDMTKDMIDSRGHIQVKQISAGYFGKPEDVANLIGFLCTEQADYITGQIIGVDGGMCKNQNTYRAQEFVQQFNK